MKKLLLAAAAAVALSSPVHAMSYSYRVVGRELVIDASGKFVDNEAGVFSSWLTTVPRGRRAAAIVFDSPGGAMESGWSLYRIIRAAGLNTGVAEGGECASACAVAWAAGRYKSIASDARVGVHRPAYSNGSEFWDPTAARDITAGAVRSAQYLAAAGAPRSVVRAAIETPANDIHWLTHDELLAWGAHITDDNPVLAAPRSDFVWLAIVVGALFLGFGFTVIKRWTEDEHRRKSLGLRIV